MISSMRGSILIHVLPAINCSSTGQFDKTSFFTSSNGSLSPFSILSSDGPSPDMDLASPGSLDSAGLGEKVDSADLGGMDDLESSGSG